MRLTRAVTHVRLCIAPSTNSTAIILTPNLPMSSCMWPG